MSGSASRWSGALVILGVVIVLAAGSAGSKYANVGAGTGGSGSGSQHGGSQHGGRSPASQPYSTTVRYVTTFYPRWLSYQRARALPVNRLVAPVPGGPGAVVALADVSVRAGPVLLTIPRSAGSCTVLAADGLGDALRGVARTRLGRGAPGRYALAGPHWRGRLPAGVRRVTVPVAFSTWLIGTRPGAGRGAAREVRRGLRTATLPAYWRHRPAGHVLDVPAARLAARYQARAEALIASAPLAFLRQLQRAVRAPGTPPLAGAARRLARRFAGLFGSGYPRRSTARAAFARAARAAQATIVAKYWGLTGPKGWIRFAGLGGAARGVLAQ